MCLCKMACNVVLLVCLMIGALLKMLYFKRIG